MRLIRRVLARLRGLVRRDIVSDEIREELDFHLRERTDQYEREGLRPDEAIALARRRVGNLALHLDRGYDIRGGGMLDTVRQEITWAWRGLRAARGTTVLALVILTLGIAAGSPCTVFTLAELAAQRPVLTAGHRPRTSSSPRSAQSNFAEPRVRPD